MYLSKIMELIPVPESPVYTGDPEQIKELEKTLDVKLPEDYYELIKTYGAGFFGHGFVIYNPFIDCEPYNLLFMLKENRYYYECSKNNWNMELPGIDMKSTNLLELFSNQRNENGKYDHCGDEFDNVGQPFPFFPEKGGLFPCGEYNGEYTLYWKTDEEKWTIVLYLNDYYTEFNMSLTEFIYKLITKEINMSSLYAIFTANGFAFQKYTD